MKIQIDGTGTENKGAELMLYAILEQIEKKYPKAEVIFNTYYNSKSAKYINTNLNFHKRWIIEHFGKFLNRVKLVSILRKLHLPTSYITHRYVNSKIDILLDAGGFQFSDQFNHNKINVAEWDTYYSNFKKKGTKIILLPQAFGPFKTNEGQDIAKVLDKYVDLIYARDRISRQHLIEANVTPNKIKLYPDFTCLVEGNFPIQHENLKGKVCIIPNFKMIKKTSMDQTSYVLFFENLIKHIYGQGKEVFLLNHESIGDLQLCQIIKERLGINISIISDLTAKEIKGLISYSYITISSRFHGVASALSSSVPCLATAWSHKYEMLLNDFGEFDRLLDISDSFVNTTKKIDFLLSKENNHAIRNTLTGKKLVIQKLNNDMWIEIWKFANTPSILS